tara:strand:- start:4726 stop:4926 length:201 start_codon:yes stop_codon:yes gene_type:complete
MCVAECQIWDIYIYTQSQVVLGGTPLALFAEKHYISTINIITSCAGLGISVITTDATPVNSTIIIN